MNFKGNKARARCKINVTIVYNAVRVPLTGDCDYTLSLASKRWHEVVTESRIRGRRLDPFPIVRVGCVGDNAMSIRTDLLGIPTGP